MTTPSKIVECHEKPVEESGSQSVQQQHHQNVAIGLAILSVVVFSTNGELLQGLQKWGGPVHISPIANLILCHSGGLIFFPYLLKPPPSSDPSTSGKHVFAASLLFALVLMGYNYAWIKSTTFIPVGITNSISQTSVSFVYLASVVLFGEPLTWSRSMGCILCVVGLLLASGLLSPDSNLISGVEGNLKIGAWLAGLSAVGVTMYQVLFRHIFCRCKNDVSFLCYFFACISVQHVVIILPLALLADSVGLEEFSLPSTPSGMLAVFISGALASAVNMLYLCVMSWGRPMLMPCTNVLTIPTLVMLDVVLHGIQPPTVQVVGHFLIVGSILLILDVQGSIVQLLKRNTQPNADLWLEKAHLTKQTQVAEACALSAPLLATTAAVYQIV